MQRYVEAIANWNDGEIDYRGEKRGWVRHNGIYDSKLKRFAPGASSVEKDSIERYEWFKCKNVKVVR